MLIRAAARLDPDAADRKLSASGVPPPGTGAPPASRHKRNVLGTLLFTLLLGFLGSSALFMHWTISSLREVLQHDRPPPSLQSLVQKVRQLAAKPKFGPLQFVIEGEIKTRLDRPGRSLIGLNLLSTFDMELLEWTHYMGEAVSRDPDVRFAVVAHGDFGP
ncbi:MAG: hypothetical protein GY953_25560, partial [bacterium]|nr:hypothetical protein [bacterium]